MASSASVYIKKISGEAHQFTAEAGETIGALKVRLADELSAPAMCQRWLLETPSALANEHSIRCIIARMEQLVSALERPKLQELMAIHRPPAILEACFDIVMGLISRNVELQEEMKNLIRTDDKWRGITRITSGETHKFLRALESFPDDVRSEKVRPQEIKSAQTKLQELGNGLLPARMQRVSYVGSVLNDWAKLALKFCHCHRGCSGVLELEDCVDVAGCAGDAELYLSLVVDLEPAISHLSFPVSLENELQAVKALKVVGNSNPQRSIRFLAPRIFDAGELGSAAAEAVTTICELQKDDPEMPELLLKELRDFLNAGLRRPFRVVLELLERVIPKGNEQVMEWVVFILDKGTEEEQGIALDRLSDSQQVCDTNATVNLILNRLFCLMDESKWFDMSESGEKFLMKGLAAVCKQETALAHSTLLDFLKDEDSNKATRAAKTVAAIGADEGLLQAVLAALEVESTRGTTWAVLEICTSLLEISSDTGPQVFQALLKELPRKQYRDNQAVLKMMNACGPLDGTLEALASYLKHANRIRRDEGVAPLLEAAKITDFYIKTFNLPEAKELKSLVKAALAQGIAEGDKECAEVLPEIVDFEGEGDEVLNSLVAGLRHPSQKVRSLCEDVFLQVVRPDDPRASRVLIRSIEQEIVTSTRCLQIKLLGDVAPRDQTEVVDLLLRLADENDVCIRSTALAQLWACASPEQCLGPLRAHLMEKDEQVRLACLGSILKLEEDLGALQELCLQSLKDGASSVILLALTTLDDRCATLEKEDDCCHSLGPLLSHGDPQVRQATCVLLGKMKQEGRGTAERLLEGECLQPWPEQNTAVLEARRKALSTLRGEVQNDSHDDVGGEEVEE